MKIPRFAVGLAVCAAAAAPVSAPGVACAGDGPRAALVVDTGSAVTRYCVQLSDESVSGIDLVELAGEQHGLDYSLGFGGEAVCRLEGVGPEGDDCFGEYPEFWGYWRGDGSGGWTWAGTGAGSTTVSDGDIDGWSWGAGDNGSNHQQPPATEHTDVCLPTEKQRDSVDRRRARPHERDRAPEPAAPDAAVEVEPAQSPPPSRTHREKVPARTRTRKRDGVHSSGPLVRGAPSPQPTTVAADPVQGERAGDGPPITGLVGLAAAGALAAAVWTGSRRRSRG